MKNLNPIWLKAAVIGGLWASFEIIVGSLLHNLHLPFSGTFLATFSVILMIAFLQIWKEKGMIWRAGLICGLMKSLSPSAVILGPMTGIMMEAICIDLFIYVFGFNLLSYVFAGIAALLSTIVHKLISLFILYGTDIVTVYVNLFNFLKKQAGMLEAHPEDLIGIIIFIYALIGALAALLGMLLGRRARGKESHKAIPEQALDPFKPSWQKTDPNQVFRTVYLFIHLAMIPVLLLLINRFGLHPVSIIPTGLYIVLLLLYYRNILSRLKKPFFWSQLILMTLIAGFLWDAPGAVSDRFGDGFLVGIEMSVRAILVVSAFSALSVEIRNPRITRKLTGVRFGNAYAALSLSFNSLPAMLDRSADLKSFVRKPMKYFSDLLVEAQLWLRTYEEGLKN